MKNTSYMFITGPEVIKAVTHEEVTKEELGGAVTHASKSGVCHLAAEDEKEALGMVRELLSFTPQNNAEDPPFVPTDDDPLREDESLNDIVPDNPNKPYDMKEIITTVADDNYFFETQEHYAGNIVIGFMRLNGHSVGVVANQPANLAGVLDINASIKGARFVRFCDAFNIPLVVFEDVPGFLPGLDQEFGGIITHGAKLLYAFCEATVPKLTVITRKAYDGAVNIIFRNELKDSDDPVARKDELVAHFRETFANPYKAAELGYIDEVIMPQKTRPRLIKALETCLSKRDENPPRKHGNIPL